MGPFCVVSRVKTHSPAVTRTSFIFIASAAVEQYIAYVLSFSLFIVLYPIDK